MSGIKLGLAYLVDNILLKNSGKSVNRDNDAEELRRHRLIAEEKFRKEKRSNDVLKLIRSTSSSNYQTEETESFSIYKILTKITSGVTTCQILATQQLRFNIIQELGNQLIDVVFNIGLAPRLVAFLSNDDSFLLQYESMATLKAIASGSTTHINGLIKCDCFPVFKRLMSSHISDIRHQAIWAVGYLVFDQLRPKDAEVITNFVTRLPPLDQSCLELPMIRAILRRVSKKHREELRFGRHFVCLIKRYVTFKAFGNSTKVKSNELLGYCATHIDKSTKDLDPNALLSQLTEMINSEDYNIRDLPVIRAIVWTMSTLRETISPGSEKLYLPAIVNFIMCEDDENIFRETFESLKTVDDNDDDDIIETVVQSGVVSELIEKLHSYDVDIVTCSLRAIAIITTGDRIHTQELIDEDALPEFYNLLNSPHVHLQRETAKCVENISNKNKKQKLKIIENGLLTTLVTKFELGDEVIQRRTLKIIFNIARDSTAKLMTELLDSEILYTLCKSLDVEHEGRNAIWDVITFLFMAAERHKLAGDALSKIKYPAIVLKIVSNCDEIIEMRSVLSHIFSKLQAPHDLRRIQEQLSFALDSYFAEETETEEPHQTLPFASYSSK